MKRGLDIDSGPGSLAEQGNMYFLGIGVNEYPDPAFPNLRNARKDVADLAELLLERYDFQADHIFTLYDQQATGDQILGELERLSTTLKLEDNLLIYYAGHGCLSQDKKRGYWLPHDAQHKKLTTYLPNSVIKDYLNDFLAKHRLLISDSCFSAKLLGDGNFRSENGAYETWQSLRAREILTSGKGIVADGNPGENSPFARELIRLLAGNREEYLNIGWMADQVIKRIRLNYEQQPEYAPLRYAGHNGGQFVFRLHHITKTRSEQEEKGSTFQSEKSNSIYDYQPTEAENNLLNEIVSTYYQNGKYRETIRKLEKDYFPKFPGYDIAWIILGHAYREDHQLNEAIQAYNRAIRLNPRSFKAFNGLGIAFRNLKDYETAAEYYRRAIALEPEYGYAYSSLAIIELKNRRFEEALGYARRGYELEPTDGVINSNLSICYHYLRDYKKRDKHFQLAKEYGYQNMDNLQGIFAGTMTVLD